MKEFKAGCGIPISEDDLTALPETKSVFLSENMLKEEQHMIKVGKPAPAFSAQAYYDGKFVNVNLEEFKGKWVYLCFYPGDFTFV